MGKEDALLSELAALMKAAQPLKLFNTYRGVPVSYEARVTGIDQGCATLNVHKYQAVCIFLDSMTGLLIPSLPDMYGAQVISLDVVKRQAVLAVFKKMAKSFDRRTAIRVQPESLITVELWIGAARIEGKLADISVNGLGVFSFGAFVYSTQAIEKNTEIKLEFHLPGVSELIRVKGRAVHAAPRDDPRLHRLGVTISPDEATRALLQAYVARRQEELLRELSFIYDSMLLMRERSGAR